MASTGKNTTDAIIMYVLTTVLSVHALLVHANFKDVLVQYSLRTRVSTFWHVSNIAIMLFIRVKLIKKLLIILINQAGCVCQIKSSIFMCLLVSFPCRFGLLLEDSQYLIILAYSSCLEFLFISL